MVLGTRGVDIHLGEFGGDRPLLAVDTRVSATYIRMRANGKANFEEKNNWGPHCPGKEKLPKMPDGFHPRQSPTTRAVAQVNIVNQRPGKRL